MHRRAGASVPGPTKSPTHPSRAPHPPGPAEQIVGRSVRPGDYLPPQPCLDGTAWQRTGFLVGRRACDVCLDLPDLPGHVLMFGPDGVLHTVADDQVISVFRGAGNPR
ncbi:MAG TPA: hypothetical protein VFJ97_11835 [Dermatophilaceae bacterium]|nr:hypothetical protein [Dermatophilaceae bacterium]